MFYSHVLFLGLLIASTYNVMGNPIDKPRKLEKTEFALPPEGLIMSITVSNRQTRQPIARLKFDIDEPNKKLSLSLVPDPPPNISLENRHGIVVGSCPEGYTRTGGFCFKDYDY